MRLILQGQPDMRVAKLAARMTYDYLLKSGVKIYEYCDRPLHGKVALVDEDWSTVGSSNLDPLSLSMNLEANVLIRDRAFNRVSVRTPRRPQRQPLQGHVSRQSRHAGVSGT